ncbi:MAG: DUF3365 domain-containing protein [Actinobacteria bacterium]|nr:MAG: DUF3365 domain-containing protein [Actinomycetota bacterium]
MNPLNRRIGSQLVVVWTATFLLVALAVVISVSMSLRALARQEAREKAEIIATRSLATHFYFSDELKPSVFKLSRETKGPDYFDPVWMSSTYAVRDIQRRFSELVDQQYYYKECAIDARSPQYEADAVERDFLQRVNADPTLRKESLVREFDGAPYLVVLERGEQMVEACMPCHSDPSLAPKDLVAKYGPTRSFGREIGDYTSAISVRIPLAQAYESADKTTRLLSAVLVGIFGLSLSGIYFYNRRVVFVPARQYEAQAEAMSAAVVKEHSANEELAALNQELQAMNEELMSEVSDRVAAEEELGEYKSRLEELVSMRTSDLERAMSEAERANAAKSLFLANISHDLRTPLNSVIGFSDVLISGMAGEMNEEQVRQVRMINDSGKYLLALVNDLLDLSRIETGEQRIAPQDVALPEVIASVEGIIEPMCEDKGIEFVCEDCDLDVTMHTDERLLRQLLLNLLSNAVKFTREGVVRLRVGTARSTDEVLFDVIDSGPGIASDELPYVFEAFTQFTRDESAKPDGAGLGLAISLRIARLLGGTIVASSTLGKGSVFSVRLPRVAPASAEDSNTPLT